ncbi:hypothetical protein Vretimale_6143 [Volvox reticuliferus]|uniref:Uncharacterized protein n=1 Tax=Volvox reticuliferus TaxID=1737510 RepID=A0A8J4G6Y8_9CHLO|nr:hypothetical protein Vretimale_6143 [Volvox reticuliferus]
MSSFVSNKFAVHHASPQEVFNTKLIILVGDHAQLPPVCPHTYVNEDAPELCRHFHLCFSPFWSLAPFFHLSSSVRHAQDPCLTTFLNIARTRQPTQKEIDSTFPPHMMLSRDDVVQSANGTDTILCSHRHQVADYNGAILNRLASEQQLSGPIIQVPLDTNAAQVPELYDWLQDNHFHELRQVAIGA